MFELDARTGDTMTCCQWMHGHRRAPDPTSGGPAADFMPRVSAEDSDANPWLRVIGNTKDELGARTKCRSRRVAAARSVGRASTTIVGGDADPTHGWPRAAAGNTPYEEGVLG